MRRKKHIDTKDVVGLLLVEVVSTKKPTSWQRMWLTCSRRGSKYEKENTFLQRMWLAYQKEIVRMITSLTKMKTH